MGVCFYSFFIVFLQHNRLDHDQKDPLTDFTAFPGVRAV